MASRTPEYLGEPTLAQVMRRPQWILALLLALVIAGVFAWLGRWQMGHAIRDNVEDLTATETVRALDELTDPIAGIPEIAAGAVASVDGQLVAGDYQVVLDRMNQDADGERVQGAWVVGHLVRESVSDANLAVAIGWAPSAEAAERAIDTLDTAEAQEIEIEGRYLPAEAANTPKPSDDPHAIRTMLPAHLVNLWDDVNGPTYGGYLVLHPTGDGEALVADAGLDPIDSVPPSDPEKVNWLNIFYAIEWVVFGVIALFLWYRLARDSWEKEHELKKLMEAEANSATNEKP